MNPNPELPAQTSEFDSSAKPPVRPDDEAPWFTAFRARLRTREVREGIRFIAAAGTVEMGDGKKYAVRLGCPHSNPQRQFRKMLKLSGRQWVKMRKRVHRRVLERQRADAARRDAEQGGDVLPSA